MIFHSNGYLKFFVSVAAILAVLLSGCDSDDNASVNLNLVEGVDTTLIKTSFDFESQFLTVNGQQLHHIDESGTGVNTFVFIHGLPTWSYLWRNVMPHLKNRGRIVAIDLIGHGKSAKPDIEYTIGNIADFAVRQLDQLDLGDDIILVLQDWGGPVGFEYARQNPDRIKGMVFFETLFAPVPSFDVFPPDFAEFQQFIRTGEEGDNTPGSSWDVMVNQQFMFESLVPDLILRTLSDEEMSRYREPFAEINERKVMWQLPQEVPIGGDPAEAQAFFETLQAFLTTTQIPKYMPHGDPGFNVSDDDYEFWTTILPNSSHETVGEGLHFLQEDAPHELGIAIKKWVDAL
ncbi:MAG: haloalkane dehalogenase [Bacteroidota bacterium]